MNARTEAELAKVSARITTETINCMMDAVVIIDLHGQIVQFNQGFTESFGWGGEVIGEPLANYVTGIASQHEVGWIEVCLSDQKPLKNIDCRVISKDNREIPVLINATWRQDVEGKPAKIITVIQDITERKKYEEALHEKNSELSVLYTISSTIVGTMNIEELFHKLVETISVLDMFKVSKVDALFVVEENQMRLITHSKRSKEFMELHQGMRVGDCLCGIAAKTGEIVVSKNCHQDSRHTIQCHQTDCHGHIILPLKVMDRVTGVLSFICPAYFDMEDNHEKILLTISRQIGIVLDNAQLHEKTKVLSLSDPLTGIANRRYLDLMLDKSIARAERFGEPLSVVMADIDYFKTFNDTYGHVAGDKLLSQIADIISRDIRQTDLVCRYGGEEFFIMLPDADLSHASHTAERIRKHVEKQSKVTLSFGVACYRRGQENKEELINRADKAMYQAKQNGRNQVKASGWEDGL